MSESYSFYSKTAYFDELIQLISKSGKDDKIVLASMSLDTLEPQVNKIMEELCRAAARGGRVSLMVDAYTFLTSGKGLRPGPLFWSKKMKSRFNPSRQAQLNSLDKLKLAGGHYFVTNIPARPLTMPFVGRSHMKFAVINDVIFVGGSNLSDILYDDLMVSWRDPETAQWLYSLSAKMVSQPTVSQALGGKDIERQLPDGSRLLVDCGIRKQSLIYEEALSLIDQAEKSIFLTCQYHPNSVTLMHLATAMKRGVEVRIDYNSPFKHGPFSGSAHQAVTLRERARTPSPLFKGRRSLKQPYLHAKLLATDKGTIIGSHNFIPAGVNFGTAEIALLSREGSFGKRAITALTNQEF